MKYCHTGISRISPYFTMFLMFHTLLCSTSLQTVTRMARTRTGDSCCLHYGEAAFLLTLLAIRLVLSGSGPAQHWQPDQFTPMNMTQIVRAWASPPGLVQPCHGPGPGPALAIFQSFLERNRSGQTIWHSFDGFVNLLTRTDDRRTDIDCPPPPQGRAQPLQ